MYEEIVFFSEHNVIQINVLLQSNPPADLTSPEKPSLQLQEQKESSGSPLEHTAGKAPQPSGSSEHSKEPRMVCQQCMVS